MREGGASKQIRKSEDLPGISAKPLAGGKSLLWSSYILQEDTMYKKTTVLMVLMLAAFLSAVCLSAAPQQESGTQEQELPAPLSAMAVLGETESSITFRQASGEVVEVPRHPRRALVTHNSIMDLWYMAGGSSLARVRGSSNVPPEAEDLPILGSIGSLNTELIMELESDLLIVYDTSDYQRELGSFFAEEGVPTLAVAYDNYDDMRVILDLFTRINGTEELYREKLVPLQREVQKVIDRRPDTPSPRVCILFASTRQVRVETDKTVTGDMLRRLGAENIYSDSMIEDATRVDLSVEYIMEEDPDIIFVVTMGNLEECRARIEQDVVSSDIWGELSAVKNGRFYYLDPAISLYRPNRDYPEAFRIMAEYLYPDADIAAGELR
jgi:iron complex transport system substrate-binding protein